MENIKKIHVLKVGDSTSADGIETFHTLEDLQELVDSYNPNLHEAPVILGHDSDKDWSKLMSRDDTEPSYGWVSKPYIEGIDLYFDVDASSQLQEFIDNKHYKKRSLGYYGRNSKNNPTPGKLYIRHLAMLGASPPAIKGLEDVKLSEENTNMTDTQDVKELLDKNTEEWLAFLLKDNGNIIQETIVAFDPKPTEENNWLYNIEEKKFEGAFITDQEEKFLFEIVEQPGEEGSDFIVSVKPEQSDEAAALDNQAVQEAQEVADSVEEPDTTQEQVAEENLEDQEVEEPEENQFGESKMPKLLKEKTITEKEYQEDAMMREDGYVDPDEAKAGTDTPRSEVDAVKDTEMTEEKPMMTEEKPMEETPETVEEVEEVMEDNNSPEMEGEMGEGKEYADVDVEAMKEELEMLRAKVRKQEQMEMEKREEEMIRFSESLYTDNKILETQFPKEDLINLFTGLLGMSNEHMVYGEGDNKKSVLDELKRFTESLPKQVEDKVQLAEGLVEAPKKRNAVKFNPNYSRGSEERRAKILATMKERNIDSNDMYAYAAINSELNRSEGRYDS